MDNERIDLRNEEHYIDSTPYKASKNIEAQRIETKKEFRRGEIWMCEIYECEGTRPYLIVSNDIGNEHSNSVIVVPAKLGNIKKLPTHCEVTTNCGTRTIKCENMYSLKKDKLFSLIDRVSNADMKKVDKCLKISVGIADDEGENIDMMTIRKWLNMGLKELKNER